MSCSAAQEQDRLAEIVDRGIAPYMKARADYLPHQRTFRAALTVLQESVTEHGVFETPARTKHLEEFVRADGDVECPQCGLTYRDHPYDLRCAVLHILCDGRRVKL